MRGDCRHSRTTGQAGPEERQMTERALPIRALIVDDHPAFRSGLRAMLEAGGIDVIGEAGTGLQAIESARLLKPAVVIMDVQMPDMDGLTATSRIKAEMPQVSVIILTAHESLEYLRQAIHAGAAGYVLKDRPEDVLVNALSLILDGESIVDSRLLAEACSRISASAPRIEERRIISSLR